MYDGVLDPNVARMLYNATSSSVRRRGSADPSVDDLPGGGGASSSSKSLMEGDGSPWGTYVTMSEAREWVEWKEEEEEGGGCGDRGPRRHREERRRDDDDDDDDDDGGGGGDVEFEEYTSAWKRGVHRYLGWRRSRDASGGGGGGGASSSRSDEKKDEQRLDDIDADVDGVRHALAVEVVASFLLGIVPHRPGTTASVAKTPNEERSSSHHAVVVVEEEEGTIYRTSDIHERAHGVAVWALSSNVGDSVSYHVDYAELLRYEHDVTVPPLWAGTVQCSALMVGDGRSSKTSSAAENDNTRCDANVESFVMRGGEFCVNLRGLDHYAEHGYKGNLSGDTHGGWKRPATEDGTSGRRRHMGGGVHVNDDDRWVTVPYAFNRGIVHSGDLPHLSAPVESIFATKCKGGGVDGCDPGISRVVVGFNVFGHDVGALVSRAPEHSRLFRRRVRLYRSAINACRSKEDGDPAGGRSTRAGGGMDLSRIRKNRGLTKLLVLAKRERVKEELRLDQERLSRGIRDRLLRDRGRGLPPPRVADIVEEFGGPNDDMDGSWPKSVDVHVHLHHMLLPASAHDDVFLDEDGLAGPLGASYCIRAGVDSGPSPDSNQVKGDESESPGCRLISPSVFLDLSFVDVSANQS